MESFNMHSVLLGFFDSTNVFKFHSCGLLQLVYSHCLNGFPLCNYISNCNPFLFDGYGDGFEVLALRNSADLNILVQKMSFSEHRNEYLLSISSGVEILSSKLSYDRYYQITSSGLSHFTKTKSQGEDLVLETSTVWLYLENVLYIFQCIC